MRMWSFGGKNHAKLNTESAGVSQVMEIFKRSENQIIQRQQTLTSACAQCETVFFRRRHVKVKKKHKMRFSIF